MTAHRRAAEYRRMSDITNEQFVRQAYAIAEVKDIAGWIACFNPDGVFVDESVGVTYRGPDEVAKPVENYGTAFSDMHRELYDVYVSGDVVSRRAGAAGHSRRPAAAATGNPSADGQSDGRAVLRRVPAPGRADPAV